MSEDSNSQTQDCNDSGSSDCSAAELSEDFTNKMIPLLREYRDRVEAHCSLWSKVTRREILKHTEQSWRLFASSVSQHIQHAAICDGQRVELTLRLREFEAAIKRLKESV